MMPCFVALATSTLSTPTPARATTLSFLAASSNSAVTFVSERTMRASYSPMISLSSSGLNPFFSSTSNWPLSRASPSGDTFSGIRILDFWECTGTGILGSWGLLRKTGESGEPSCKFLPVGLIHSVKHIDGPLSAMHFCKCPASAAYPLYRLGLASTPPPRFDPTFTPVRQNIHDMRASGYARQGVRRSHRKEGGVED
jgi:hypothetical protein